MSGGLAASTLRLLLAEGLIIPSGIVTAAYLGRTLGPGLYGLFSVATAVTVTLEWMLGSLLGRTTVKMVGEADDWRRVAATILVVHFAVGCVVTLGCWAAADALAAAFGDPRLSRWIALLAAEIPIAATATACRNVMTGRGNYRGRALSTGIRWLVRPIMIVVLIESGLGVTGAVLGSLAAAATGWAIASRMAGVSMFRHGYARLTGIWQLAVPVFLLSFSLRVIDKLGLLAIQAAGRPPAETGFYAAAQNFAIAPGLMALSFSPLLLAELTRLRLRGDARGERQLIAISLRLVSWMLPLIVIGAVSSREVVALVYGPGFEEAARLAWPLLAAAFGMLLVSVATSVLIALDRARLAAVCVVPAVVPTIVALAMSVPEHGAWAAANVTAAVVAAAAAASVVAVRQVAGLWPSSGGALRAVLVAALLGAAAAVWTAPGGWIAVKLALLAASAPVLLALLGEFAAASRGALPATGDPQSTSYWNEVAAGWGDNAAGDPWRSHADAVNMALCTRWWPASPVRRVLKTDLFDEIAGHGLLPAFGRRTATAVGIDRSVEAGRLAARRGVPCAVTADARALPFAPGTFDLVVSNSTLDHFSRAADIAAALREIRQVLAPEGRLILTLDNPSNPIVRLRNALPFALLNQMRLVPYFVGETLDERTLRVELESVGLRVVEVTAILHCPRAVMIAGLGAARHLLGARWQQRLSGALMAFERLERWPSRNRTGYYIAVAADAPSSQSAHAPQAMIAAAGASVSE